MKKNKIKKTKKQIVMAIGSHLQPKESILIHLVDLRSWAGRKCGPAFIRKLTWALYKDEVEVHQYPTDTFRFTRFPILQRYKDLASRLDPNTWDSVESDSDDEKAKRAIQSFYTAIINHPNNSPEGNTTYTFIHYLKEIEIPMLVSGEFKLSLPYELPPTSSKRMLEYFNTGLYNTARETFEEINLDEVTGIVTALLTKGDVKVLVEYLPSLNSICCKIVQDQTQPFNYTTTTEIPLEGQLLSNKDIVDNEVLAFLTLLNTECTHKRWSMSLVQMKQSITEYGLRLGEAYQLPLVSARAYQDWCVEAVEDLTNVSIMCDAEGVELFLTVNNLRISVLYNRKFSTLTFTYEAIPKSLPSAESLEVIEGVTAFVNAYYLRSKVNSIQLKEPNGIELNKFYDLQISTDFVFDDFYTSVTQDHDTNLATTNQGTTTTTFDVFDDIWWATFTFTEDNSTVVFKAQY